MKKLWFKYLIKIYFISIFLNQRTCKDWQDVSQLLDFFFLLSGVVHYQCFDGHGVPLVSVFRCSYHFCFFYFHPNTEALCIGNCLPSSATLSLNFSTYAKVFYFFISHNMSKEAHLSP